MRDLPLLQGRIAYASGYILAKCPFAVLVLDVTRLSVIMKALLSMTKVCHQLLFQRREVRSWATKDREPKTSCMRHDAGTNDLIICADFSRV